MAERIVRDDIAPALVLCSSARRARETLAPIQLAIGNTAKIEVEEGLYGASADQLLQRLRRLPESAASVMLIGHNPGIQELAVKLVSDQGARSQLSLKFPTAALAALRLSLRQWRELSEDGAELITFLMPRDA
jgi:phosphohistidine phosphatase